MTRRQKRRLIIGICAIILVIFAIERAYNSREEFHVYAEDANNYGIVEAMLTSREKLKDFDYLYMVLEENYPFFKVNERLHGIDWLGNKRKYRRLIRNTKSDAEFYIAMKEILGDLNNSHVDILDGEEFNHMYKNYYLDFASQGSLRELAWFDVFSSPFVMYRYQFEGDLDSIELDKDAVLETKVLVEDELAYMKIDQMPSFDRLEEDFYKIKNFLKDVEDYDKLIIDIRGNKGEENLYWKNIVRLLADKPLSQTYHSFFKRGHMERLDPFRVEYINTIKYLSDKTKEKIPEEIVEDFSFYKIQSISINPRSINHNPSDYIDFKGKIYLLVDDGVYSAAEAFASFAKETGFATLVGETTGGDRVFERTPVVFLPTSKFAIRYARELTINEDGSINMESRTRPHIEVDPTPYEDFNQDKCIQAVIEDGDN